MSTDNGQPDAGPHRSTRPYPPIDPALCYPWRRLADWGFGTQGVKELKKAGLSVLQFHKAKFFMGSALIAVLENGNGAALHKVKPGHNGEQPAAGQEES